VWNDTTADVTGTGAGGHGSHLLGGERTTELFA